MSGHGDSIRERRAREIRFGEWEEEDSVAQTTMPLGLLVAQRFRTPDEQAEVILRIHSGRLSLEYVCWNGRTDNDHLFANFANLR